MNSSPRLAPIPVLTGIVAAIVLAVGAFALIGGGHDDNPPLTPSTSTSIPAPTVSRPANTVTTAPAPTVIVPKVVGLSRDDAVSALQASGLEAHVSTLPTGSAPPGFVLSQSPLPAMEIEEGLTVELVVSAAG